MSSLSIEAQRGLYPGKSDEELAQALAVRYGYIVVVRYKNSPSASHYTDFGTCTTEAKLNEYLQSRYCHDIEIIYDGRLGARQRPAELPAITPEILHDNFVEDRDTDSSAPGAERMKETVSYWNGGDYDTAFSLLKEATGLGLGAPDAACAHCLLGQIYIKRRDLVSAVSELVECLRCSERSYADAWQSAQRLYYVYNEMRRNEEAKFLRLFAKKVNMFLRWRHTAELEAEVRNLAHLWKVRG